MMKSMLMLFACCLCPAYGGYEYADRVISAGEYVPGVDWLSGTLVVDGGGAMVIEALASSKVEVYSTSTPLGTGIGGIMDLCIDDNSRLDYYGGVTEELVTYRNAVAHLQGGRIDGISSAQYVTWVDDEPTGQHIFIYARDGWEWKYENGKIRGIAGSWLDSGTPFDIRFTTRYEAHGFDPVWANVKVVPEPATLLLMGLGAFLPHRRRD
ncbi:MAG TPA: PEP-CTERM sorting domain-containing protein [Anaerohalosphaeraceae bacterium]|nr:PEP-CTERM sorting domain-containing protein [Anaerohalosphaeraceae bacterium]